MAGSSEYTSWSQMKDRCYNKNDHAFYRYGGRGITVCDRWRNSFINFFSDMGPRPSPNHSIDRIDNNGNYEPSNCRWATIKEQNRNRRDNSLITVNGVTKCLVAWVEELGICRTTIQRRMQNGMNGEEAVLKVGRKPRKDVV